MKNIICPISDEKVLVSVPRINAFFVIVILMGLLLNYHIVIISFLIVDFFIRGFINMTKSPLTFVSLKLHRLFKWRNEGFVNKAPKIFAARLGFMFTVFILVLQMFKIEFVADVFSVLFIFFAVLECALNFCLGCWVFTIFIHPFYSKR